MLKAILDVILTKEGLGAMVRHALNGVGAWLAGSGLVGDEVDIESVLAGVGALLAAIIWSLIQKASKSS